MSWARFFRCFVVYPILVLAGFHLLLTGSPIPLWSIDELHDPTAVKQVSDGHLVLVDGGTVPLPFIRKIPKDNHLFQAAIAEGVEVHDDGNVVGITWVDRICGNDAFYWRKCRVNLSDLAGALEPTGIDDEIVHCETIDFLDEARKIGSIPTRTHAKGHLSGWDLSSLRAVRKQFENSVEMAESSVSGADSSE